MARPYARPPEQLADAAADPLELAKECPRLGSIRFGLSPDGRGRLADAEELVKQFGWGRSAEQATEEA